VTIPPALTALLRERDSMLRAHRGIGWRSGWVQSYLHDPGGFVLTLLHHLRDGVLAWGPVAGPILLAAIAGLAVARRWWARQRHARMLTDARLLTILAPPTVDPAGAAAVWSNLVGLLRPSWRRAWTGQPHLCWEYGFSDAGVSIRLWVPGTVPPGLVERAVEAAWPGAHTRTQPATPPLPEPAPGQRRLIVAGQLRLGRPEALPIRTSFDADPIRALLGAPVGLGRGEYACVQVLARPVTGRRVARARRSARRLHTGGSPRLAGRILDLLTPRLSSHSTHPARAGRGSPAHSVMDPQHALEYAATNRAVVGKQRGSHYETLIRYAVVTFLPTATPAPMRAKVRDIARGRAHALASAFAGYTEQNHYTRTRLRNPAEALAERCLPGGDLLSVAELGGLAHLPLDAAIPGVQRAGARAISPPPGVPVPGRDAKPLGLTDTGHVRPVGLRVPDARHHMHVLGSTGSGKSTFLGNLILDDIRAGRGVVVIDPKGDLVTDLLARMPLEAGRRLVLIDADAKGTPPCLNPLHGGETDREVDNLVSVFRRVYSAFWGPRTDDVFRAGCLTLRAQHGVARLDDLPRLLNDATYRARVVGEVTDPVLRGFWEWYDGLSDAGRSQTISPLLNKLRAFLLRPFVRQALSGGPSTVDMDTILNGGILLCRIPKGSLGEETTRLIGSLVVARVWQATTGRARMPQRERHDASLLIDECHNFLHLPYSIEDMLAEARGFRLSMTLAHQHLGQLPRELREGISTNARTKIYFTSSPGDARDLALHTAPRLSAHDLAHLGVYHAAVRMVLRGEEAQPFTIETQPLPRPIPGRSRAIRGLARQAQRAHTAAAPPIPGGPTRPNTGRPGSRGPGSLRPASPRRPRPGQVPAHPAGASHQTRRPASGDPRRTR
jgi:hypothetical protein